jgi:TRAP-type C4-dicarboxylate transport system substrate-binding protein
LSLARLDYDAFKRNVDTNESFKQLPEEMREVIKERADKLHEEMEQEVEDLFTEDKKLF